MPIDEGFFVIYCTITNKGSDKFILVYLGIKEKERLSKSLLTICFTTRLVILELLPDGCELFGSAY